MKKLIWATVFLMTFSVPAWAQDSLNNLYCSDYYSSRVKITADASAQKISEADINKMGNSIININPGQLPDLSENARLYAASFSCDTLLLGHLMKGYESIYHHYDQVENADCWAAGKLLYGNILDKAGLRALEKEINKMSREQWSHFPGPVRVVALNETCELRPMN
jgi:hypothetical protein